MKDLRLLGSNGEFVEFSHSEDELILWAVGKCIELKKGDAQKIINYLSKEKTKWLKK